MLIYHPAFDASHCAYRILKIFNIDENIDHIDANRIKIVDFYMVFPKQLKNIRFPKSIKSKTIKSAINQIDDTYRPCKSPYMIFQKMGIIQERVLKSLVINEYLEYSATENKYKKGIRYEFLSFSKPIFEYSISIEVEKIILDCLMSCEVDGKDGLKDRTALMEYRYDR